MEAFFDIKDKKNSAVFFSAILVIRTLSPDPISLEVLDPIASIGSNVKLSFKPTISGFSTWASQLKTPLRHSEI